jgi:hypothetical protein
MGRARSIVLETRTFAKAGDASAFFSAMLNQYSIGDRVSNADADHLAALLKRHDEPADKIGPGIAYFEVGFPPGDYPGKCFWIVWADGGKIDFSIKHCLERKPYD